MSMICEGWAVRRVWDVLPCRRQAWASSSICSISRHPIESKRILSPIVTFDHTKTIEQVSKPCNITFQEQLSTPG